MSTTRRVLHTDSDNHKVVLQSETVNKRLIRQFVTYDRYDAEYEYLTSFHAACLILLGVELERCYIPEISVRMFKKAHAALCDKNRRPRIMRYLRARHPKLFQQFASQYRQRVSGIRDAFNPEGRVEIEIGGEKQIHQGPILSANITCKTSLIGRITLPRVLIGGYLRIGDPMLRYNVNGHETWILDSAVFRGAVFAYPCYFDGVIFEKLAKLGATKFADKAKFTGVVFNDYGWLTNAVFGKDVDFSGCEFNGPEAKFANCKFAGKASFYSCTVRKSADFRQSVFEGEFRLYGHFYGWCDFRESIFRAEASLNDSRFHGKADFSRCIFQKNLYIQRAHLREVDFKATFRGDLFVDKSTFHYVDFGEAIFEKAVVIRDSTFASIADFTRAEIKGEFLCESSLLFKGIFAMAHFREACAITNSCACFLDFTLTAFNGNLVLHPMASDTLEKEQNRLGEILREAKAPSDHDGHLYGEGQLVELRQWRESGREFFSLNFQGCVIHGGLICDFACIQPIKRHAKWCVVLQPHQDKYWEEAQKQYAWLKEQYRKQGRYGDEDEAHWWASECARKGRKAVAGGSWLWRPLALIAVWWFLLCKAVWRNARSAVVRRFLRFGLAKFKKDQIQPWRETSLVAFIEAGVVIAFAIAVGMNGLVFGLVPLVLLVVASFLAAFPRLGALVLYCWVFGYGVRPRNVVLTALIVIFVCGVLFSAADAAGLLQPLHTEKDKRPFGTGAASSIMTGFYFSVITFATVGYGDVSATGWAAGLAMVEGLLGVVLNAALIVVIFRKLIR